jgi:Desulfoferrodoxin
MKTIFRKRFCFFCFVIFLLFPQHLFANEPVVSIQILSEKVQAGEEIEIQLTISHNANYFFHFVEWVDLFINREQSNYWAYSAFDLPPAKSFKKVVKYKVPNMDEIIIVAEAGCIRHGSSGKVTLFVPVKR